MHTRWNKVKLLGQDISNIFFTIYKCLSIRFISIFENFVELNIPMTDVSQSCLKPDFPYLQKAVFTNIKNKHKRNGNFSICSNSPELTGCILDTAVSLRDFPFLGI